MALVSISKAAKLAGINRSNFYTTLIEQLKQQLVESKEREQQALEREQFYQQQLKDLTQTIKLL